MTLWIVGMTGSAASTLGRRLADRLGMPEGETDSEIELHTGQTIGEIWATSGEPVLRALERDQVRALAGETAVVVTGDGVPMADENRRTMKAEGTVIWLFVRPATLLARLGEGIGRPPGGDGGEESVVIDGLLRERAPVYAAMADVVVDGDAIPSRRAAEMIAGWLQS